MGEREKLTVETSCGNNALLRLTGMKRITSVLITGLFFLQNCNPIKEQTVKPNHTFSSFEMAYSNGWNRGISFCVDSTKIFFSPKRLDSVRYGILPDSIFYLIDTLLSEVLKDTLVKSRYGGCVDCPIVVIIAKKNGKTINIQQADNIDPIFQPIAEKLQSFIDKTIHKTINATMVLESQNIVFPPPAPPRPLDKNIKFRLPQKIRSDNV